jgi:hypothetical protein
MIKQYFDFLYEDFDGYKTRAEYIEALSKNNDYAKNLIAEYTKDIDADIRIANAVNTLDTHTQKLIIKMIKDEKLGIRPEKEISVNTYTSTTMNESDDFGGKNIFKCFLKVLSALGQKDCDVDWKKTPKDYLCLFITDSVNIEQLKGVMSRYLYFDMFIQKTKELDGNVELYFGIKSDLNVEYGVNISGRPYKLGSFILTQGTYNYIMTFNLKSASNLKKFLVYLDLPKLTIMSKVKTAIQGYFPGQSESKIEPTITGDVITFAYQGLGKWDNNQIDEGELNNIKNNLRSHLMQFKWSEQLQFNINPSNSWIFINIKIK